MWSKHYTLLCVSETGVMFRWFVMDVVVPELQLQGQKMYQKLSHVSEMCNSES